MFMNQNHGDRMLMYFKDNQYTKYVSKCIYVNVFYMLLLLQQFTYILLVFNICN